jgi:hypothetical protein
LYRGAGNSQGRTSWTGKAELADYISFVGFLTHYIHHLAPTCPQPLPLTPGVLSADNTPLSPIQSSIQSPQEALSPAPALPGESAIILLLAGYSYGSLITSHLPPTKDIIARFDHPEPGTAEAEIKSRSRICAIEWNRAQANTEEMRRSTSNNKKGSGSPHRSRSILMGGEESQPRRSSRDSRRSIDILRHGSHGPSGSVGGGAPHHRNVSTGSGNWNNSTSVMEVEVKRTAYLTVSPILPPTSNFLTLFTDLGWRESHHKAKDADCVNADLQDGKGKSKVSATSIKDACDKKTLEGDPAFAIFGDQDIFVSVKKLRKWSEKLVKDSQGKFQYIEITGAGHLWHEQGVDAKLRSAVKIWAKKVSDDENW